MQHYVLGLQDLLVELQQTCAITLSIKMLITDQQNKTSGSDKYRI